MKEVTDEDVHRQFLEADCDLLLLMKREELSNLQWLSKLLLFKVKTRRIDILIEVKKDTPLLPAATDIKENIPSVVRRVCQLSRPLTVARSDSGLSYFVAQSWPSDRETRPAPRFILVTMLAPGDLTASRCVKVSTTHPDTCAVQVDNKLVPQVLRVMEKKGNAYRTSQGRARGVFRIAHHTMGAEERLELIGTMLETSYFAMMSLGQFAGAEFNNCEVVLQIYPMTAAKEDVAPRLWSPIPIVLHPSCARLTTPCPPASTKIT